MHEHTNRGASVVSRRTALRLTAGLLGLSALGTATAGCSAVGDSEPDIHPLQGMYDAAREDVELFSAAQAKYPAGSPEAIALAQLTDARTIHRDKLVKAMEADGTPPLQPSPTAVATDSATPTPTTEPEPPGFADLSTRLDAAAKAAREHALGDYGYRRVLAASIGAACTAGAQVLLAPFADKEGPR